LNLLLVSVFAVLASCDDDDIAGFEGELVVVTEGRTVHLLAVEGGVVTEIGSAEIPGDGLLFNHSIFSAAVHPGKPWLYVTSLSDCGYYEDEIDCWTQARIDRFTYDENGIAHAGAEFLYDAHDEVSCVDSIDNSDCAPVGVAFSPDGTRFYVDDDSGDTLHIFSVDAVTGALTYLYDGGDIDNQGFALHPDGQYLYNGSRVIDITGDVATLVMEGTTGNNATVLRLDGAPDLLVSTVNTDALAVYDLTDPTAPDLLDTSASTENTVRFFAVNALQNRIVTVGRDLVTVFGWDGDALSVLDEFVGDAGFTVEGRGIALTGDDSLAIVTWFVALSDQEAEAPLRGGVTLLGVAGDGTLTELDTVEYTETARVALALPLH
jgi:WD40 repeat protein